MGIKWIKNFKYSDYILSHEAGHGYRLKLLQESQKEKVKTGRLIEIHNRDP